MNEVGSWYRLYMRNAMQSGYLIGQEPPTPREEAVMLLDRAEQNVALIQDPNVPPEQKTQAMDELTRLQELGKRLGNGNNGNAPS